MTLGLKPDYDNGLPTISSYDNHYDNSINNHGNSEIKLPGYSGTRASKAKGKLPKFDEFGNNGISDLPGYSSSFVNPEQSYFDQESSVYGLEEDFSG